MATGDWLSREVADGDVHVVPLDDGIVHGFTVECPCGPSPTYEPGGILTVHHSLDGRERHEPDGRQS